MEKFFISAGVKGGDIMTILSRGGSQESATKAGMGKRGVFGRFGGGKNGRRGVVGFLAQNRMEGQNKGQGG